MFAEVKRQLPISGDGYDAQICDQIMAAVYDLTRTAEITLPGNVSVIWDDDSESVVDSSTVTDSYIITAIATWCAARIGNPPNYDNLLKAYESIKGNLRLSSSYSTYGS